MKKVRFRVGAFFLALLAMLTGMYLVGPPTAQTAEQKAVMLNLTQPIEANKSSTASARFAELTQEAMKYGMADATITGQVEYSMQPDRTIRSSVRWNSVSVENGGKKVTEGLESSLNSQFRVPESSPRAEPGTRLKAVGDVEALATALGKLKAQLDAQNVVVQKEEKSTKTQSQAVSPTVSAQDQGNQGKYLSDVGSPFNTVVEAGTTTTYAVCDEFFVDVASMKAVKQYKPVYTKGGVQTGEGVCAPNYSEFTAIKAKDGSCTYRFDFANATAAKQEQLYYLNGSTEVLVGGCRDSSVTYPLYESRTGCSVAMDLANKKAFPTSKQAFKVGNVEMNATECRAVAGTTGIDLFEEACDPMYEHDFVNNVSYLVTRLYYIDDQTGQKVYASQCGRSSTVSFPHVQDTTGCGWVMDDEKRLAYQQGKSIIKTGTIAGDVVVQDCHTIATVNYSYLGTNTKTAKFTASGSFTVPVGTVSASALVVAAGGASQVGGSLCNFDFGIGGLPGQAQVVELGSAAAGNTLTFTIDTPVQNWTEYYQYSGGTKYPKTTLTNGNSTITSNAPTGSASGNLACSEHQGYRTAGRFGISSNADVPNLCGSIGWGAGAPGGKNASCYGSSSTTACSIPGFLYYDCVFGIGLPGVVIFEYATPKYMRPDGTTYEP